MAAKTSREARTYCTWCKTEVGTSIRNRADAHSADGQACPGSGLVVATR